ncbi:Lectin-domain containing receptor kinase VI.4 [Raphanus sativus]|nr:Lectin-domain containing receptor kinase VI.4 [Raphanus sativus]
MLLVYDYIPNGSLDSLLHSVPRLTGTVLSWTMRFHIAKGIASGLLYLHEEGEQVRDIKSSNVLIDEDMNPRLGDFGLARLYERGSQSHTTVIIGTPGYMAPELTSNGYPSSASHVYSYGVLLLEIVSGVSPTKYINFKLPVWIMAFYSSGEILNSVDQRLQARYHSERARAALIVGLICTHQNPECRPSMAMVMSYLNEQEPVPNIDETWGVSSSSTTSPAPFSLSGE